MTAAEMPLAAEVRRAAVLCGQGQVPSQELLRQAADSLTALARQVWVWQDAHRAAVELVDLQGAAVELLREVHSVWAADPVGSGVPAGLAVRVTKALLAVDRPDGFNNNNEGGQDDA